MQQIKWNKWEKKKKKETSIWLNAVSDLQKQPFCVDTPTRCLSPPTVHTYDGKKTPTCNTCGDAKWKSESILKDFSSIEVCICKCRLASAGNVFSLISHLPDKNCCTSNTAYENMNAKFETRTWQWKRWSLQRTCYFDICTNWSNSLRKCSLMNIYYYSLSSLACIWNAEFQANVNGFMRTLQYHGSQCSARSSSGSGRNRRPMAKAITFTENRLNTKLTSRHFHADTFPTGRGVIYNLFYIKY